MEDYDLNNTSVLLFLRLAKPGNRRKVNSGMVEVDADKESISVSKDLLNCPELAAITTLDGSIRRWIYARALPSAILKEGVYRLPVKLTDDIDKGLKDWQDKRQKLIEEFLEVYPEKVQEAFNTLRALYDPSDYPPIHQLRQAFDFQWRFLTMGIPQIISQEMMEEEREKAAKDMASEIEQIRLALRSSFAELVRHAASVLEVDSSGKPKIFRDTMIGNMEEFLRFFDVRNLTDDRELAKLVEQARTIIHGVSPEDLRKNMDLRKEVRETMNSIKQTIDTNVMLKPTRRLFLAPEPEAVNA